MAYPKDDLDSHLSTLDDWACRAALLPDVPEPRLMLLKSIRSWVSEHKQRNPSRHRKATPAAAGVEREIRALHQVIEADRRVPPRVGDHRQSTTACGAGPEPGDACRF